MKSCDTDDGLFGEEDFEDEWFADEIENDKGKEGSDEEGDVEAVVSETGVKGKKSKAAKKVEGDEK